MIQRNNKWDKYKEEMRIINEIKRNQTKSNQINQIKSMKSIKSNN